MVIYKRVFPSANFTGGFTRLILLTVSENIGALMAVVLSIKTKRGKSILAPRFQKSFVTGTNKQNVHPAMSGNTNKSNLGKKESNEAPIKSTIIKQEQCIKIK